MNFSQLVKPAVALAFLASFTLGASADPLRKSTRQLNLNTNQRAQVQQILKSGNRQDPATRQRMQQQILSILSPQQQQQLAWQLQNNQGNYGNPNVYQNPVYNTGANQGYQTPYTYQAPYGSPVYQNNQECNTGVHQGYQNQQPYGNPGYQQSPYVNQQSYPYPNQGNYNYYPNQNQNQNQGMDIGLTMLGGLLNSGILNGVFQQMMR